MFGIYILGYLTSGSLAHLSETMRGSKRIVASRSNPAPEQNDLCCGNITIKNAAAFASVDALRQFLAFDDAAGGTSLFGGRRNESRRIGRIIQCVGLAPQIDLREIIVNETVVGEIMVREIVAGERFPDGRNFDPLTTPRTLCLTSGLLVRR